MSNRGVGAKGAEITGGAGTGVESTDAGTVVDGSV